MLHSHTFVCRDFRAHTRAQSASAKLVTSTLLEKAVTRTATRIYYTRSSHSSGEGSWVGPCPRLATRPMLRQICRTTRRLSAARICPYDTIRHSCVKKLLHRDLNRGVLVEMKQSNLGSYFGSKAKNGDDKVRGARTHLFKHYRLDKILPAKELQSIQSCLWYTLAS